MATTAPAAAPGSMSLQSVLPGVSPAQFQSAFTASAVGGGNPYVSPTVAGQAPQGAAAGQPMGVQPQQLGQQAGGVGIDGFGPIMSNYLRAYDASIAKQRGNIDAQLAQALGELGQRRDAAAGVIAGLPAQVGANASEANANLAGAGQAATAGLDPGAAATIGAVARPSQLKSDISAAGKGYAGMAPLLNLANMANAQGGEALLRNSAIQAQAGLDQQEQQYMQGLQMMQLQSKMADDQYARHAAIDDKYRLGDMAAQATANMTAQEKQQADAQAQQYGFANAQAMQDAQSSPAYHYALMAMNQGLSTPMLEDLFPGQKAQLTPQDIIDKYKTNNPDVLRALAAGGFLPAAMVQNQLQQGTTGATTPTKP